MDSNWVSQGQIICRTNSGDQVTVFRMRDANAPAGMFRDRYVLANNDRVVVERNGDLRIAGSKTILQPVSISRSNEYRKTLAI